jgi:hypothetical protein
MGAKSKAIPKRAGGISNPKNDIAIPTIITVNEMASGTIMASKRCVRK